MSTHRIAVPLCLLACLPTIAACGEKEEADSETSSTNTSLEDCPADQLETLSPGQLTVATDEPAFPPYFVDEDPTNGEGFESAVAYAIAEQLGFAEADVKWVVEPFNSSYAPGPKDFDFDVNQISITPKRAEQVDFSAPYYTAKQAIVALRGSEASRGSSLADFAEARFGVQIGTTSQEAVEAAIAPSEEPRVYDTSNDVVTALKQEQVDAVVVDVPSAFFLTAVQVPEATTVGQFSAPGGDEWGALLEEGSPLTDCVSAAIEELRSSGELAEIEQRWIAEKTKAPVLE